MRPFALNWLCFIVSRGSCLGLGCARVVLLRSHCSHEFSASVRHQSATLAHASSHRLICLLTLTHSLQIAACNTVQQHYPCMFICYSQPLLFLPHPLLVETGHLLKDSIGGWLYFLPHLSIYPVTLFFFFFHSKTCIIPSISAFSLSPLLSRTSPTLSSCCVVGLQLVLRGMSEALVDRRAAPALITLCSGPEL